MTARYPNLELIEYIFKEKIIPTLPDFYCGEVEVEVFLQTWSNTATAFSKPGYVAGQAFTREYTTIITLEWWDKSDWTTKEPHEPKSPIYGVFFGNRLGYIVQDPSDMFFEDWKKHRMKEVIKAKEVY